jgi:Leucine-rich repeat (LRR) protein
VLGSICGKEQCPVKNEEFAYIANCKKLKKLWIVGTTLNDLSWISELKELEEIVLCHNPDISNITELLGCTNLKKVDIRHCPGIRNIPTFPSNVEICK